MIPPIVAPEFLHFQARSAARVLLDRVAPTNVKATSGRIPKTKQDCVSGSILQ